MVNERNFRIAWNLMWHYKHILDEGIGDSELLEEAQEGYEKNKKIVDKYYGDL